MDLWSAVLRTKVSTGLMGDTNEEKAHDALGKMISHTLSL